MQWPNVVGLEKNLTDRQITQIPITESPIIADGPAG